jgi:hypothetical protein
VKERVTVRRAFFFVVAAATPLVACQLLVGIDDDRFSVLAPPAPAADASSEEAAATLPDLCAHRGPPPPPEGGAGGENRTFYLAVDRYVLNEAAAGFDLDEVCTCDPLDRSRGAGQPTCAAPEGSAPACDGDGGLDNTLGRTLEPLSGLVDVAAGFNRQVDCGRGTLLLVISNYNGEADDLDVKVSVIESIGIRDPSDGGADAAAGCGADAAVPTLPPKRDGTDRWDVPLGVTPGVRAQVSGWVRDFNLVIDNRRVSSTLPFYFGATLAQLSGVVITGRLVPLGPTGEVLDGGVDAGRPTSFRLVDGTLAGRAPAAQVLVGAGLIESEGVLACKSAVFDAVIRPAVCGAVDTMHDTNLDLRGLRCDAISVAARFEATPAELGDQREHMVETPCGPDWDKQTCP